MCGDGVAPLGTARLVRIFVHTSLRRFVKYRLRGCGEAVGFFGLFSWGRFIYLFMLPM